MTRARALLDRTAAATRRMRRGEALARAMTLTALMETAATCAIKATARASPIPRKVFIPLTKLCRDSCHYCTFAQPPRRNEGAYLTPDQVWRSRARAPPPTARRRCSRSRQARAALTARPAPSLARSATAARSLISPHGRPGAARDAPSAPQSGVMSAQELARLRRGVGVAGLISRPRRAAVAPRRGAFRLARQAAGGAASKQSAPPARPRSRFTSGTF